MKCYSCGSGAVFVRNTYLKGVTYVECNNCAKSVTGINEADARERWMVRLREKLNIKELKGLES